MKEKPTDACLLKQRPLNRGAFKRSQEVCNPLMLVEKNHNLALSLHGIIIKSYGQKAFWL